jgi:hypothetical protein
MTIALEPPNGSCSSPPLKSEISDPEFAPAPPQAAGAHNDTTVEPHRCEFTFSDGRRCRSSRASFCVRHATIRSGLRAEVTNKMSFRPLTESSRANSVSEAPLPSLVRLCSDLTNTTAINRALTQVFLLMAQGRISQKQAVAFGYLSQLLLQTLPGVRSDYIDVYDRLHLRAKLQASLLSIDHAEVHSACRRNGVVPIFETNS